MPDAITIDAVKQRIIFISGINTETGILTFEKCNFLSAALNSAVRVTQSRATLNVYRNVRRFRKFTRTRASATPCT